MNRSSKKKAMKSLEEALEIYIKVVWCAVPAVWIPIILIAIWSSNLLSNVPVDKIGMTHGLFLVISVVIMFILWGDEEKSC